MSYLDVYIGDLNDPTFKWDGADWNGNVPTRLSPFFPDGERVRRALLARIGAGTYVGKQTDWGGYVAKVTKQEILRFLDEMYSGHDCLQELPGILNWAIKGCLEWQKSGLGIPSAVIDATEEYREEEDEIGEFLTQTCFQGGKVERTALYSQYVEWSKNCQIRMIMRPKNFAKQMRVRAGISERKSNGKWYWHGISIPPCVASPAYSAAA